MSLSESTQENDQTAWLRVVVGAVLAFVFLNVVAIGVVAFAPERCSSCHQQARDPLELREEHSFTGCGDCHGGSTTAGRLDFAARQVYVMYLKLPVVSGRTTAAVSDQTCSGCHDPLSGPSEQSALRMDHATCTGELACTDCHSRTAHGDDVQWPRSYDMFECVSCHMTEAISVECDLCHTPRSRDERIRTGSFALTHGAGWRQTHGMGDSLACAACHPVDKCFDCHGPGVPHEAAFARNHSVFAVLESAQCTTCHTTQFCSDCHGLEMPHHETFASTHSTLVQAEGRLSCDNCHDDSDCTTCHILHVHPGNARQSGGG